MAKIIKIFENYNKIKEISELANDILKNVAIKFNNNIIERHKETDKLGFEFIPMVELKDINYKDYNIIREYIKNENLTVRFYSKNNDDKLGDFDNSNKENNIINIFYELSFLIELNKIYEKNYKENNLNDYREYYINMYIKFHSTLIHEIQHSYDNYISRGKFSNDKFTRDYTKASKLKKRKKENNVLSKKELDFIEKNRKEYWKMPYEVNARYSQTITDISFYDMDLEVRKFKIKPFKEILNDFTNRFISWGLLDYKMKKRLKNRLYKDWIISKDLIKKKE